MAIGRVPGATGIQPSIVTAKGDLIVATANGSVTNQAVGSNNQVLMADSAQADGVKWANEATATLTAKGDILSASAANTLARLAVGTNNFFLGAASGETTGLKWLGAGISYTPTLTGLTVGNGTNTASYVQIGKVVYVEGKILFGTTTSITGDVKISLPVNTADSYLTNIVHYLDWGTTEYTGYAMVEGTNNSIILRIQNVAGTYPVRANISATVPHTWANQDIIYWSLTYVGV